MYIYARGFGGQIYLVLDASHLTFECADDFVIDISRLQTSKFCMTCMRLAVSDLLL